MHSVSVIIPTWNGVALLRAALASLDHQTFRDFEVVVVDNGSSDGTEQVLQEEWPGVRRVRFEENRGFAVAVNAGIAAAAGEILVLMNNDVEAEPGWLHALVSAFDRHPEVAACASKMLAYHDRGRIDSTGDQLGVLAWSIGHGDPDGPAFRDPRYVFSACAGAAAYRRGVLDEVGGFDERFFAYLEDVDLGARIQLAGWRCLYVPDAVVYHHGSATARRDPAGKLFLLLRNSLILFFQYMPPAILAAWTPAMLVWPWYRVLRERRSPALAARAVVAVAREAANVVRWRREIRRRRRISHAEFRSRLSLPRFASRSPRGGPAAPVAGTRIEA